MTWLSVKGNMTGLFNTKLDSNISVIGLLHNLWILIDKHFNPFGSDVERTQFGKK